MHAEAGGTEVNQGSLLARRAGASSPFQTCQAQSAVTTQEGGAAT